MFTVCACMFLAAQPGGDWQKQEAAHLKNVRQVTRDYRRAGEGYFSPDAKKIIFQAEEEGDNPFYQMFVMDLDTGAARRVSPGVGKTTCGFFHPDGTRILFASTHLDPDARKHYEIEVKAREEEKKSKKRRRYVWDFDPYMTIFEADLDGSKLKRLTFVMGYHAEGSYSRDGKHIVFCSNRASEPQIEPTPAPEPMRQPRFPRLRSFLDRLHPGRQIHVNPGPAPAIEADNKGAGAKNLELYIMDADGKNVRQLTNAPGCYNGGPFFSPDGKKVIFRSDRKKKDHLQLYVINADGTGEKALTDDPNWVFWAPYWYKDGKHIIYTAADHSNPLARPNYDLYWMNIESGKKVRLTYAPGADVLPVFSPDYTKVMWTSTRDGRAPAQLYLADFVAPVK